MSAARNSDGTKFVSKLQDILIWNSLLTLHLGSNSYIGGDDPLFDVIAKQFTGSVVIPLFAALSSIALEIGANKGFTPNPLNDFGYEVPIFTILSILHAGIPILQFIFYNFANTW